MTPPSKQKKKTRIRSFERDARVQRLLEAGIIKSAGEIPNDAIPARVDYIQRNRSSSSLYRRPPYYRDIEFRCEDCGKQSVWTADDQRHWYEQCTVHHTRRRSAAPTAAENAKGFANSEMP